MTATDHSGCGAAVVVTQLAGQSQGEQGPDREPTPMPMPMGQQVAAPELDGAAFAVAMATGS